MLRIYCAGCSCVCSDIDICHADLNVIVPSAHAQLMLLTLVMACSSAVWEVWTGRAPFQRLSKMQVMLAVVNEGLRPEFPAGCPAWYVSLAAACWQQDPQQRWVMLLLLPPPACKHASPASPASLSSPAAVHGRNRSGGRSSPCSCPPHMPASMDLPESIVWLGVQLLSCICLHALAAQANIFLGQALSDPAPSWPMLS